MKRMIVAVAAAAFLLSGVPAAAQNANPWKAGDYWDVSAIKVKDGYGLTYAKYLAETYVRNLNFQKSKGWIKEFRVLTNEYPREGEPDIYLIRVFDRMPTQAEMDARQAEWATFTKMTPEAAAKASADRSEYRTNVGDMLLREQVLR